MSNTPPRAFAWAEDAHLLMKGTPPPIDLNAVARNQRVRRLGLRLMIHRGALLPVEGGFELYLRDLKDKDLDIDAPEPPLLTTRQRHAFAHELAHTVYYRGATGVPSPTDEVTNHMELERICDGAARRLLVPASLVQKEVRNKLGDCDRIDAAFIRSMKVNFNASYEVTIGRIGVVESGNAFARCILLIRKNRGQAEVVAWYFGVSLLSVISEPKKRYQPIREWFADLPEDVVDRDGIAEWEIMRRGRALLIQKFPLGKRGDFLLQIDDLAHKAPSSGLSWHS